MEYKAYCFLKHCFTNLTGDDHALLNHSESISFIMSSNMDWSYSDKPLFSNKSLLLRYVRFRDSFSRHSLIRSWLPDKRTSETFKLRIEVGREYWGGSKKPVENESCEADS